MAPHLAAGWQFGLPLDVGAEQSIAMRRQATTRAVYNDLAGAYWAIGGVKQAQGDLAGALASFKGQPWPSESGWRNNRRVYRLTRARPLFERHGTVNASRI